jgi:omega-3 fatty acid desaturase (delta-15 desaturase)
MVTATRTATVTTADKSISPVAAITKESIRDVIPAECFEISTFRSILSYIQDVSILLGLYYLRYYLELNFSSKVSSPVSMILQFIWWNLMGFFYWCLFVVGHDCGHRTFSSSLLICDIFGHLSHTVLLVPFNSWRLTHLHHHLNHNNIDKDITWKPLTESQYSKWYNDAQTQLSSLFTFIFRFTQLNCLLFPFYLLLNNPDEFTSGNHFNPYSKVYSNKNERLGGFISVGCVLAHLAAVFYYFPLIKLIDWYFVPLIIGSMWLSIVTYLHHTDEEISYYDQREWSYVKGALSTIDRVYFHPLVEFFHHNIGTHIVHHLFFTSIPHYNLTKATAAVKNNHPKADLFMREHPRKNFLAVYWESVSKLKFIKAQPNNESTYKYHSASE